MLPLSDADKLSSVRCLNGSRKHTGPLRVREQQYTSIVNQALASVTRPFASLSIFVDRYQETCAMRDEQGPISGGGGQMQRCRAIIIMRFSLSVMVLLNALVLIHGNGRAHVVIHARRAYSYVLLRPGQSEDSGCESLLVP